MLVEFTVGLDFRGGDNSKTKVKTLKLPENTGHEYFENILDNMKKEIVNENLIFRDVGYKILKSEEDKVLEKMCQSCSYRNSIRGFSNS